MLTKLKDELDNFLLSYAITGLGIFRDWIIKQSGIDIEKGSKCRLVESSFGSLHFRSECLTAGEVDKIASFLNKIPVTDPIVATLRKDGSMVVDISLNKSMIFDYLLPRFKQDIAEQFKKTPEQFKIYQLLSQDRLEDAYFWRAWREMNRILKRTIDILPEAKDSFITMANPLSNFSSRDTKIAHEVYEALFKVNHCLDDWLLEHQELLKDPQCQVLVKQFKEAILGFEQFNREKARREVANFFENLDEFLSSLQIKTIACDIFDEFLFSKAKLGEYPRNSQFRQDASRICFTGYYENPSAISSNNITALVNSFKEQGDDSAYLVRKVLCEADGEDKEFPSYVDAIEQDFGRRQRMPTGIASVHYNINVSGELIAGKVFAEFKEYVKNKVKQDPSFLQPYQKASEYHFKKVTESVESKTVAKLSEAGGITLFGGHTNNVAPSLSSGDQGYRYFKAPISHFSKVSCLKS